MRRIVKTVPPAVLQEHRERWTAEYVEAVEAGEAPTGHWGHVEIRESLGNETSGRCAYCESYVSHVSYEHVEHIRPKSKFPELSHEWSNLTAACQVCNTRKSDYYDDQYPLVHPCEDDPTDHIGFLGGLPIARNGSETGRRTIDLIGLNRLQLVHARDRRLLALLAVYQSWLTATGGDKVALEAALTEDAMAGEYPSASQEMLRALEFPLPS